MKTIGIKRLRVQSLKKDEEGAAFTKAIAGQKKLDIGDQMSSMWVGFEYPIS